jgi:hypothetical protein
MVNFIPQGHPNAFMRVRPDLPWPPPESGEGARETATRRIGFKVWRLDEIQDLAKRFCDGDDTAVNVITDNCSLDMQRLSLDKSDVSNFILRLLDNHYVNSAWCRASSRPGVRVAEESRWYPCDAYCISIDTVKSEAEIIPIKYYIKMCKSATGKMLLIISMHESDFQ